MAFGSSIPRAGKASLCSCCMVSAPAAPPLPFALRWAGSRLSASKFPLHSKIFDQLLDRGEEYRLEPVLPQMEAPRQVARDYLAFRKSLADGGL